VTREADDRILIARLDGSALRLAANKASEPDAIAELHRISTRPDLLGRAAGRFLADTRHDHPHPFSALALRLLAQAGAGP